jgi:hypothetical protein
MSRRKRECFDLRHLIPANQNTLRKSLRTQLRGLNKSRPALKRYAESPSLALRLVVPQLVNF